MKKFGWHADPGHAWLEVPKADVVELGVMGRISGYSYIKGDTLFLEEDCDASVFLFAWKEKHGEMPETFNSAHTNNDSPIRRYARVPCPHK